MNAQDLKNSILQLAMEGKLVEQRQEEGTARELLQTIQEEKARLVAEKKIKKTKPLPPVTEEEEPFDIPESWEWVRWGNVVETVSARRVHKKDWQTKGVPFYRAREIAKLAENGVVNNELFISEEMYKMYSISGVPHPGDLMITAVGTLGKTYIVQDGDKFYYKDASVISLQNYGHITPKYLKFAMESPFMLQQIKSNSSGTTVSTLTIVRMNDYLLPLPPLAEQKRIVTKIEELLPYVEEYDKAQTRLQAFEEKFPEDMKKSILQYAMEGKLVEQRQEEGNARELLQAIQEEKAKLVAEKKIKKIKPLPPVTEEEKPFDIPESWEWVRWGNVVETVSARRVHKKDWQTKGVPFYRAREIAKLAENGVVNNELFISEEMYKMYSISGVPHPGDLMITAVGTLGKTYIVQDGDKFYYKDASVISLQNYGHITPKYLKFAMESPFMLQQIKSNSSGTTVSTLTIVRMNDYLLPLPPLAEQKRIVAKIEEMMPLVEKMQKK